MCIDSGKQIHVTFDPDTVLTSIEVWRNAVEFAHEIPTAAKSLSDE
jgi:hypothetical protein